MPIAEASVLGDVGTIGILILLEGLLSADNALVIALLVKHLPPQERRKALLVGLVGSFTFRFAAILLAQSLIDYWYLQMLGAIYLLYLPIKHFLRHRSQHVVKVPRKLPGFWKTVAIVEFTDLVFAVDSILVAVSLSDKIWIVWVGGISGVVLLRFAAFVLVRLLDRMPGLEHMAYVLVGWVAVKLAFMSLASFHESTGRGPEFPHLDPWVFWSGMVVILVVGIILARRVPPDLGDDAEIKMAAEDIQQTYHVRSSEHKETNEEKKSIE
ncbi:MAG: TerC family protein [Fimbriimonadales bacterium]